MRTEVLDHGYVELIEAWGSDERIVEAARMSTGKGFKGWGNEVQCFECDQCGYQHLIGSSVREGTIHKGEAIRDGKIVTCGGCFFARRTPPGDEKLLRYLWEHRHATPFEMAGMIVEVQAPIFVFREWHRHRTQSYNEMSARYTPLPDVNYVPTVERLMMKGGANKQASAVSDAYELNAAGAEDVRKSMDKLHAQAQELYALYLNMGVPKELARCVLPVARYSRMRASANLRNWLAFLTLRMDAAAQWEIRQYANAVGAMIAERFPKTWQLFSEGAKS